MYISLKSRTESGRILKKSFESNYPKFYILKLVRVTKKILHIASFERRYFAALPSSVYSKRLFLKDGNLYEEKRNRLLPKTCDKL